MKAPSLYSLPLLLSASCIASLQPLSAASITWDGSENNNWRKDKNWTGGGDPGSSDVAIFPFNVSRNGVDLSNSSNNDTDRSVNQILFAASGANDTTEPGFEVDWYLKNGRVITPEIRWQHLTSSSSVRVFADFLVNSTTKIHGTQSGGAALQLYGNIQGNGTLNISAEDDEVELHAAQDFTGTVNLNGGTLKLYHNNALANAAVNFNSSDAKLSYLGYNSVLGKLTGSLGKYITLSTGNTLTVGSKGTDGTYSNGFASNGVLSTAGHGNLVYSATNNSDVWTIQDEGSTSSGNTTINKGVMRLNHSSGDTMSFAESLITINSNGSLDCSTTAILGNLSGSGDLLVNGNTSILNKTLAFASFSGGLYGTHSLTIASGSGIHVFNGNTGDFSGDLILEGGDTRVGATRFANSEVTVSADNALNLTTNTILGNLKGSGDIDLDHNLTLGANNTDVSYSGTLTNNGALTKNGTGRWLFNGIKSGTGAVSVNAGKLRGNGSISGNTSIASEAYLAPGKLLGTITFNSDLILAGGYEVNIDGTGHDSIDVGGSLNITGSELILTGGFSGFTESVYIIATYGALTGSFDSITGLPADYYINYHYDVGSNSNHIALIKDVTPPTLDSISTVTSSPTNANSVEYMLTFSEDVTGFDAAADLEITTNNTLAVNSVSITPVSGSVYTVSLSGITGDGSLVVAARTNSDIIDIPIGNALSSSVSSSPLTVDNIAPTVSFNSLLTPIIQASSGTLDFVANLSEQVTGLDDYQDVYFTVDTAANTDLAATTVSPLSNNRYKITLNNVSGDGKLQIHLRGANITDLAGNAMTSDELSPIYIIDQTPPQLISTTASVSSPSNSSSITYTFTFDEDMKVDVNIVPYFTASNEASVDLSQAVISDFSDDLRTLSVTLNDIEGDGILSFGIQSNEFDDQVNNGLLADLISPSVTIDNTAPTVSFSPISSPTNDDSLTFVANFSEDITGLDDYNDIYFTSATTARRDHAATVITQLSPSSYSITLHNVLGDGNLQFRIRGSSIADLAGNNMAGDMLSPAVLIDNTEPTVSFAPMTSPTNDDSLTFVANFSEDVIGLDGFNDIYFTAATTATTDHTATEVVPLSPSSYRITLNNVSGDGNLQFRIHGPIVTDLAGNQMTESPLSPAVIIDNTAPVISLNGSDSITLVISDDWLETATVSDHVDPSVVLLISGDSVSEATAGNYTILYDATDTAGNVADQLSRTVNVISHYEAWSIDQGLTVDVNADSSDDPDGDGLTNLEEFALDGNPLSASNDGKVVGEINAVSTDDYMTLTLPVRTGASFSGATTKTASIDAITYFIQSSTNLSAWNGEVIEVSPALDSGLPALSTGWKYRTFRYHQDTESAARVFMQVIVQ